MVLDYPFIEPAKIPRTKYGCKVEKMMRGNNMEIKAPAGSRCQFSPKELIIPLICIVNGATSLVPPR